MTRRACGRGASAPAPHCQRASGRMLWVRAYDVHPSCLGSRRCVGRDVSAGVPKPAGLRSRFRRSFAEFQSSMRVSSRFLLLPLVLCTLPVLLLGGCRRGGDSQPPVATPSITLSRAKAALGSPLEITYKFVVARDTPKF